MERVARGDRAAFATLFDRHQGRVVRFCLRFVKSQAQAEELAQDIFVKLYRSASRYQPQAQFKTFLFRVATNHCLNELRRGHHHHEVAEAPAPGGDEPGGLEEASETMTPHEALEGRELEAAVHRAMERLSDRERAAFSMCRFEGLAYRDIAFALDSTESAVKSLIHRATVQVMEQVEAWQAGLSEARRSLG